VNGFGTERGGGEVDHRGEDLFPLRVELVVRGLPVMVD
jgi:hypothetical protein